MAIVFSTYIDRLDNKKKNKRFNTNSGTECVPVYEYDIVDGVKILVCSGERNLNEEIQSFAESTDINNIVNRFLNGETDLLNVKEGIYGDFTDFPTTYAEVFKRVQQCENVFNQLPTDLREKFDNSYYKFWEQFGSEEFDSKFEDHISSFQNENGNSTSVSASGEKGVETNAE